MAKITTIFSCSKCDAQFPKWQGRCTECGAWGTLQEQIVNRVPSRQKNSLPAGQVFNLAEITVENSPRLCTGLSDFDEILGPAKHPGLAVGSLILLSGDPGIGKSTLVLQLCGLLAKQKLSVLYVSGEESAQQIKIRAERLQVPLAQINFLGESDIDIICSTLTKMQPQFAVIDSAQTMFSGSLPSEAGTVNQIRAITAKLLETAKATNTTIVLIGHITKDGQIAGPKTLEHLVDVVLSFEGDPNHAYRLLRVGKNRFGPTGEVAVFDMQGSGLVPVKNPAEIFLTKRQEPLSGSAITAAVEGSRVFLLEMQALAAKTAFGYPQRKVSGYDLNRLLMLVAVLSKRAEMWLQNRDLHLNIAGGFTTKEPALDLAAALAVASAYYNHPLSTDTVILGEIGLGGEIRPVSHLALRLKEISRLGFKAVVVPADSELPNEALNLDLIKVRNVNEAIRQLIREN
jgi:DNA repair protein RadA/Sms